ncbi:hypothetical protein [Streptomyces sp. 061-3]|uniref:hypothetical protein n=1 Tax=Streptomyces sp. 061-3 TaxID=2789268 RepID=UPI003980427C
MPVSSAAAASKCGTNAPCSIANLFELRHRRADQRGTDDEAFLDWIFWWYLATVELTNKLVASRSPA